LYAALYGFQIRWNIYNRQVSASAALHAHATLQFTGTGIARTASMVGNYGFFGRHQRRQLRERNWLKHGLRRKLIRQGANAMGCNQKAMLVVCVSPGINGKWDVSEKGFEEPLASFDDKEDAYAYAAELTQSKQDSTALVEDDEGFSLLPVHADSNSAGARPRNGRR
jgi:hypothetical protein